MCKIVTLKSWRVDIVREDFSSCVTVIFQNFHKMH